MINGTIYLRVTRDWAQIIDVAELERPVYVTNPSGVPVEFFLSSQYVASANPETNSDRVHTIGGSIGSVCVDNQYFYARSLAESDDTLVTLTINDGSSNINVEEQATKLEMLLTEVIKLTSRVNEDEQKYIRDRFSYFELMRYVVTQSMTMENLATRFGSNITNLFTRVLGVELMLLTHKTDIHNFGIKLDALKDQLQSYEDNKVLTTLNDTVTKLTTLQNSFNKLEIPDDADITKIADKSIKPVIDSVAALNNTIASLTSSLTAEEIIAARDELIELYTETIPELVPVITNLADYILRMISGDIEEPLPTE